MLGSTSNNLNLALESRTNSFVFCPFELLLNRTTTMDHDMLAALVMSTNTKTHRLVMKCAATANAAGANINIKNVNTKVILPLLETFVHKHGQDFLVCDIIMDSGPEQAYKVVPGEALGALK